MDHRRHGRLRCVQVRRHAPGRLARPPPGRRQGSVSFRLLVSTCTLSRECEGASADPAPTARRRHRGLLRHAPLRGPHQVLALPHRHHRRRQAPDRPPDQRHPVARPLRRADLAQRGLQVALLPRLAPLAPEGDARIRRRRGARGRPDAREGRQAPDGRARPEDGLARDEPQRHGPSPLSRRRLFSTRSS